MKYRMLMLVLVLQPFVAWTQESTEGFPVDKSDFPPSPILPPVKPVAAAANDERGGVEWKRLLAQSFALLLIEHGYRYATEPATRDPDRPFFQGYVDSVTNLHGWADGDPFYVNYVGHPMQGAVSGFIWIQNDRRYRDVEFGRNADYWKSRLRAGAFAWAYSEQMEIGPLSEASVGNIQASFPQQGFVDHVVTPAIGLGWLVTEDVMDRYVIRFVEQRTRSRILQALVRGGLNPSRSLANVINGQWPWARTRGMGESLPASISQPPRPVTQVQTWPGVAPFELATNAYTLTAASGSCMGGGATAGFRVKPQWQIVMDVHGCKMIGLQENLTGDALTYMAGLRWTPRLRSRWSPYLQFLAGGIKVAQEQRLPDQPAALSSSSTPPDHDQYTRQFEFDSFAFAAGAGVDLQLTRALALRVINVDYVRSFGQELNGFDVRNKLQIKGGIVLHMGNW